MTEMETLKHKRGDTSPDHPGLVFEQYKLGKECWVTPAQRERNRLLSLAHDAARRANPEIRAKRLVKNKSPEMRAYYRAYMSKWVDKNRDEVNARQREAIRDPEAKAKRKANYDRWITSESGRAMKRLNGAKFRSTTNGRISNSIRSRIHVALRKGGTKSASTLALIGCTIPEFQKHLEAQFTDGMQWNNYGQWEIDHHIPLASFDLSKPEQQRKAFHFSNCQPLWMEANRAKNDRIPGELFRGRVIRKITA